MGEGAVWISGRRDVAQSLSGSEIPVVQISL